MLSKEVFEESLLREDVVKYYLAKTKEELLEELGPEVAIMKGFEQKNSHHCYDLYEHTMRTVEGINLEGLTMDEFKKLRIAAFFHDIGKPDVSKFNPKTGQQVFYGHAVHSVEVAKPILERLGYSEEEINQINFYIAHHDDFISYKTKIEPDMQNHQFIREINDKSVAEKIIENQYDFKAMGYDQSQIRAIVYTLANGEKPEFKDFKGEPIIVDVDMEEVINKINSAKYNMKYVPTPKDYDFLLRVCKADAGAQSEIAIQNGKVVGSKAEKLENMSSVENSISNAFEILNNITKENSFEDKEENVNIIDITKLGLEIGMEEKQQVLPNGKLTKSLVWDQENLLKAVNAVKHLSGDGKPVRITGPAPAWLVSALTHTVHPCPVGVYMPQIGKDVDIPKLAHGEKNPEGEVGFKITEKGDAVLIEYNMELPDGFTTYDESNLSKVVVPEIPEGKAVYISGRGPNYLTVAIAEAYAHTNSSVSLFQPGIGYTCSITHSRSKKLGDLTKDPLGKEEMKEKLSAEKEEKIQKPEQY